MYRKDSAVAGKFAFTSDSYDMYTVCFATVKIPETTETVAEHVDITLSVKVGVDARSYNDVRLCPFVFPAFFLSPP